VAKKARGKASDHKQDKQEGVLASKRGDLACRSEEAVVDISTPEAVEHFRSALK
jgi:hypothetical protein